MSLHFRFCLIQCRTTNRYILSRLVRILCLSLSVRLFSDRLRGFLLFSLLRRCRGANTALLVLMCFVIVVRSHLGVGSVTTQVCWLICCKNTTYQRCFVCSASSFHQLGWCVGIAMWKWLSLFALNVFSFLWFPSQFLKRSIVLSVIHATKWNVSADHF